MDTRGLKTPRELPPLPQRGHQTRPTMPSQDIVGDISGHKHKKKKARKETEGMDDLDDQGMEMGGLSSRRTSETVEPLPLEAASDAPPQRRKKKKKTATRELEEDQTDLVNGYDCDQTTNTEVARKPKKKKKSKVAESQLPDELDLEEDDVISDTPPPIPQHTLFSAPHGQSQPVGKIFVERNNRFQAADRSDRRKTSSQVETLNDFQQMQPVWTTRDVSLRVHEAFRVFGLYCHGFLAGYAVWNTVVMYMLAGQHLTTLFNLLEYYHPLVYPSQSLFYMLLAISTVATFDRVNLAKGLTALRALITMDPMALASFLYVSALVLSLSQQMTSDRINLYPNSFNATLWPQGTEHQILHPWLTVNLVVALLVGLAWILIATRPEMDYSEGHLMAMEIEPPKHEDKSEMAA